MRQQISDQQIVVNVDCKASDVRYSAVGMCSNGKVITLPLPNKYKSYGSSLHLHNVTLNPCIAC